jgi:hypothetical protein
MRSLGVPELSSTKGGDQMEGRLWLLTAIILCSSLAFAQGQIRDGSGGGNAHYCIQRGVTDSIQRGDTIHKAPWPVVTLQNTCSEAVLVYFCYKNDLPDDEWGCGGPGLFEANHKTTWEQMDELKLACVQPGSGSNPRPDPSCSGWTLVWNAEYKASNKQPARPDVPKPQHAQSGR